MESFLLGLNGIFTDCFSYISFIDSLFQYLKLVDFVEGNKIEFKKKLVTCGFSRKLIKIKTDLIFHTT